MNTNPSAFPWRRLSALAPISLVLLTGSPATAQPKASTATVDVVLAGAPPPASPPLPSNTASAVRDAVSTAMREAESAIQQAAHIGRSVAVAFAPGGTPRTLVLPGDNLKAEDADRMSEDLAVMSRILDRALAKEGEDNRFFIALNAWNWKGRGGAEAFYLDGFGALFLLSVDFPLVGPARESATREGERPKDTTWEDARRELQGGPPTWEAPFLGGSPDSARATFEPGRVDELRDKLLGALKHAANIRGLRDHDTLAVAVFGPSAITKERREVEVRTGGKPSRVTAFSSETGTGGSVMTLRVTRADIEALATGRIDGETFAKRVAVSLR